MSWLKRWWWAPLAGLIVLGFWRVRFDVDVLNLLPPDEPTVRGLKLYQQHFTNARELIISVRAPEAEQAERLAGLVAERLRQETNLVAAASWRAPWMEQPDQLAELLACLWFNQPPAAFGALTNRLAPDQLKSVLSETKETLATSLSPMDIARRAFDPYDLLNLPALTNFSGLSAEQGQKMFSSSEGNFRLVFVQARPDLTSYRSCASWLASVQATVNHLRANQTDWNGVVVRYTGRPAFVTEIAGSMQRDLSGSIAGTAAIIALLFWLTHRRWLPMLWLLTLLALILAATLALGGLVLGTISVVSMGFAAVLLGLAVDYAVVHYQEALAHPTLTVPEIRRAISPSILWAAITTISAFLVLNLGGLPGLAQLGSLVAIGVALAALVMVMVYLPPLFPDRRRPRAGSAQADWWSYLIPPREAERPEAGKTAQPALINTPLQRGEGWWGVLRNRFNGFARGGETVETVSPLPLPPHTPLKRGVNERREPREFRRYETSGVITAFIVLAAAVVLWFRPPHLDRSANALRLQHCEAEAALDEVTASMGIPQDPLWVIVSGSQEKEVYDRLREAEGFLNGAVSNRLVSGYLLPTALWPRPEFQEANRPAARVLGTQGPLLRETALENGFNTNALFLTDQLLKNWAQAGASAGVVWPTNQVSQWLLKRFVARATNEWMVMGLVYPATNRTDASSALASLSAPLARDDILLSGWSLLGSTTLQRVRAKLWLLVAPMVVLVLLSLWLAFRRPTEILLGAAMLMLSGLCLLATMSLAGWSWNLLNLMALPLMLGTGVDYGIFMQLALRRHGGDLRVVRRSIGRALLLCGGTAIAGFGSLAWSGNAGMASLGKVCAVGIGANMLISVFLLPSWWVWLRPESDCPAPQPAAPGLKADTREVAATNGNALTLDPRPSTPSPFYRAWFWRLGLALVRFLPGFALRWVALFVAEIYYRVGRARREVVIQNFLPLVGSERAAAARLARALFREFAVKLTELWRFESGSPVDTWFTAGVDWGLLEVAARRGKGVLLLTPHLGNWEIGGALMAQRGHKLLVLTQAEPGQGLTELRKASRARWDIETIVIGSDGFEFVEVIKRLQDGAVVALLIDRPPPAKAVTVELFGRSFRASIAAAELARASGCALLGVTVVRHANGYAAQILAEFQYERQNLGNRDARRELTQQILTAFEPEIRRHPEQWFHFVPVWPEGRATSNTGPAS